MSVKFNLACHKRRLVSSLLHFECLETPFVGKSGTFLFQPLPTLPVLPGWSSLEVKQAGCFYQYSCTPFFEREGKFITCWMFYRSPTNTSKQPGLIDTFNYLTTPFSSYNKFFLIKSLAWLAIKSVHYRLPRLCSVMERNCATPSPHHKFSKKARNTDCWK